MKMSSKNEDNLKYEIDFKYEDGKTTSNTYAPTQALMDY